MQWHHILWCPCQINFILEMQPPSFVISEKRGGLERHKCSGRPMYLRVGLTIITHVYIILVNISFIPSTGIVSKREVSSNFQFWSYKTNWFCDIWLHEYVFVNLPKQRSCSLKMMHLINFSHSSILFISRKFFLHSSYAFYKAVNENFSAY